MTTGHEPRGRSRDLLCSAARAAQHVAQGTSLITQVPPAGLAGVRRHWQNGNRSPWRWIVWIGIGFLVGGAGGGYAAAAVSDSVLQWTYVVYLVALMALYMTHEALS